MRKLLFVGMAAAFASVAFGQELLTNGGFETGDLTGWTVVHAGGFSGVRNQFAHSGTFEAYFGATSAGDAEDFYQDVATTAGTSYHVSFWAFDQDPQATTENLLVTFGTNTVFNGIPQRGTTSTANWAQYSGDFVATSGSTRLEINGWEQSWYINADDFSVTANAVPEPASMAVLGLGALALIRRRRAKK
ncbi:MAG TPA: carbohydrate binding domain-containing protein [Fimbriimonadaceae bacterium]|nr:carbohydrate binding domain-containing protein [Fimbriimonadaceae bacterium]